MVGGGLSHVFSVSSGNLLVPLRFISIMGSGCPVSCVWALLVGSTIVLGGGGGSVARDSFSPFNGLWENRSLSVVINTREIA